MDLLSVNPGAIIWTIINFSIFLFLIIKFGAKPIINGIKAREEKIAGDLSSAEKANEDAKKILADAQSRIDNAQKEMADIIANGRKQADDLIAKAKDEAEAVKRNKLQETVQEIEQQKKTAINELRKEVADLVVMATEKILGETLDKEKHFKMVENYIDKLPNN